MNAVDLRLKILVLKIAPKKKLLGAKFDSNLSFENHVTSFLLKGKSEITRSCKNITLNGLK